MAELALGPRALQPLGSGVIPFAVKRKILNFKTGNKGCKECSASERKRGRDDGTAEGWKGEEKGGKKDEIVKTDRMWEKHPSGELGPCNLTSLLLSPPRFLCARRVTNRFGITIF